MSRSNPSETSPNPSRRWFEWAGGHDGGRLRYYDKERKENIAVGLPYVFLLLDELSCVRGWHDPSESGIYSNEVRDTRQDALIVRAFKGGELAAGVYASIRDRIKAMGGHFQTSLYIAFKGDNGLQIGNIAFKGAALSAWMEFKKANRAEIYKQAVAITGFTDERKGSTNYRVPTFALKPIAEESQAQALLLDAELQAYLQTYLGKRRDEQAEAAADTAANVHGSAHSDDDLAAEMESREPDFVDDDIPF